MSEPLIHIEAVTKSFGSFTALHGIDIDIGRGEFFSLLGASGCGKTTLLRILAGIEEPTTGQLLIDGQDMRGVPPEKRPTNMVFQSYAIFPHLNVEENIGYGLRNLKLSRAETRERIGSAVELVKLGGMEKRNAHALSGGQRQRVALARALVMRPKVLLLDEPLSALDKKLREEMQLELRAMQRSLGITFVFVTHDQEEAMTLSDRIAMMSDGRILQLDTPKGLYERPANREVAEFIGTMNLIPAKAGAAKGNQVSLDAGALGKLEGRVATDVSTSGREVFLALRPERISVGADLGANARLKGKIAEAVYLGDRITYVVAVNGLAQPLRVVNANETGEILRIGAEVEIGWPDDSGLVLS